MSLPASDLVAAVFAYGTLKQGQCREHRWPVRPKWIIPATMRGTLWDLGEYPGLTTGDERIAGELWEFEPGQLPRVLSVLDAVEGYGQKEQDWFVRRQVDVMTDQGVQVIAWVYYYARTLLASAKRVLPDARGVVQWP